MPTIINQPSANKQQPTPKGVEGQATACYHCGETCDHSIIADDKAFCCEGCQFVYQLLNENNLCNYYELSDKPGIKVKGKFSAQRFAWLDNETVQQQLLRFRDEKQCHVQFHLPQMHCASCIWLLENLHTLQAGVLYSKTNFQRKEIFIAFDPAQTSLRKVVELLAFTGYEPYISLNDGQKKKERRINRKKIFRIGVAGFCFSNIMMLSFPEYFSSGHIEQTYLANIFSYLNLTLSLPVLLYSASDFFTSAWKGLRQHWLNIDAPIALAILVTFGRSAWEILSGTGAGYLDSMSGIVFFMLIGRWFQDKTYDSFSFDRDYKSYFPLGVTKVANGTETTATISELQKGDRILVRHNEMIPADAILLGGDGLIDYSFVSGENTPLLKRRGELIYAGGKQTGGAIELEVVNPVEQSYITQLWNRKDGPGAEKNKKQSFIHPWSRYFTIALLSVAGIAALYWAVLNPANILPAVTATLIVACPCSLLLSATFTFGNMLRYFGKNKLYLKNASVIEAMARINTIVFDKTGTLTYSSQAEVSYEGDALRPREVSMIYALVKASAHPLSRILARDLLHHRVVEALPVKGFREVPGQGIEGMIDGMQVQIGSRAFIKNENETDDTAASGRVYWSLNGQYKGLFRICNQYRPGIREMIGALSQRGYQFHVLSGDHDAEKDTLRELFGKEAKLHFYQSPQDKLTYISKLKQHDYDAEVLMLGDGLNDAGALAQADVGIAVSENSSQFTPASDAILDSTQVHQLAAFLGYARSGKRIVTASFIISVLYNFVGVGFAVAAALSPMIAAILMPVSSITIVAFVTLAASFAARDKGL